MTNNTPAQVWAEIVEVGLGDTPAREYWRHLMATYTPRFPGSGTLIEETLIAGEAKGRAEGRAARGAPLAFSVSSAGVASRSPRRYGSGSRRAPTWRSWVPGSTGP